MKGGTLPPPLFADLERYLAIAPITVRGSPGTIVGDVEGLCNLIEKQGGIRQEDVSNILGNAFDPIIIPGGQLQQVLDCLEEEGLLFGSGG
jgi:hypothetical protein